MGRPEAQSPAATESHLSDAAEETATEPLELDVESRQIEVGAALHGERLDKALVTIAGEFSRNHLQHLIEGGHVRVDGVTALTASRRLRAGQQLQIDLVPTAESLAFRPQPMALAILFEDAQLIVIDKPAGLVVHPAPGNWSGTLLNGLLAHHAAAAGLPRAGIVHRLDKDTSGAMVVGKTLEAVTALSRDIAARTVQRRYLALAQGDVATQRIEVPIGRDPVSRLKMAVLASGKPARTDVEWLAGIDGFSAVRCTLHTGRTHQIRVHLASRGHALVADAVYGGRPALGMTRQALHAYSLRLQHPLTRGWQSFDSPPPADFSTAWRRVAGMADTAQPRDGSGETPPPMALPPDATATSGGALLPARNRPRR
jgi:23S rRNA pseudouridine1911/1915/1917 synthase